MNMRQGRSELNDRRLEILDWPEQLHHVLDHLERTTHQEFTKTQMDDGFVRRSPVTSPMSAFKGNVSLSRAERAALDEFSTPDGLSFLV